MTKTKEKIFNPDVKQEVSGGILNGLIFLGGIIISVVGFILAFTIRLIGDIVWLGGAVLIIWSIMRSAKQQHGRGFKVANRVIKIIVLVLLLIFVIIANTAPRGL